MPFRSCHPPVAVQVRAWLAEARACGMTFEDAWAAMLRRTTNPESAKVRVPVHFPHATGVRYAELAALEATKPEWRAAFVLQPTPLSMALDRAFEAMDDELDDSSFAAPAGARVLREVHLPPGAVSSQRRGGGDGSVRLDSRDVFARMFAGNEAKRELRAA